MIGLLVAGLLLPMFAKLIRKKEAVDELVEIARNILLSFSIVMVSISFFYHQEIITSLYSGANVYWGSVYGLLLFSYWGVCLSYIYGTLLTANESISTMNRIFVAGVLLNLCLNFLFIFWWKAWCRARYRNYADSDIAGIDDLCPSPIKIVAKSRGLDTNLCI